MVYFTDEQKRIGIENIDSFLEEAEKIECSAKWLSQICLNYANTRIFCVDEIKRGIKELKREKTKLQRNLRKGGKK